MAATALQTASGSGSQAAAIQAQLSDLNAQKDALTKFGLSDTSMLVKNADGSYAAKPNATGTDPYAMYAGYKNSGGNLSMTDWESQGRPGSSQAPTVGNIYGGVYAPNNNQPALNAAESAATGGYSAGAPSQGDEYSKALNEYQDQIDAINNLYATQKASVTKQYTDLENNRLGSEGALIAGSGAAGTTYGNMQTDTVRTANTNELTAAQQKVDADKQAAIASIMGQVRVQADKSYQDKLTAYSSGADKAVAYLKDQATQTDTNASNVANTAVLKGLDLSDPKNQSIVANIAQQMGVDPSVIVNKYVAAKKTYDASVTKQAADNAQAAANLAKTIQETNASKTSEAETRAQTAKIYSDIANGGTYQSGGMKIGKSDLSTIQGILENGNEQKGLGGKGSDGYANTNTYITLYNTWTSNGGLAKDFVSTFPPKSYLNPGDPTLPAQLQDAIKATPINVVIPGVGN